MDFQRLSITLSLLPLLAPAVTLASNSNAKPSESYAIGEQRPVPKNHRYAPLNSIRVDYLPLPSQNDAFPPTVFANTNRGMSICKFLDYHDFAHINRVSRSWHHMVQGCLDADPPLMVTNAAEMVAYTKRLIKEAPDLNRQSVIKELFTLCNRSYCPEKTFLDSLILYQNEVPHEEQLYLVADLTDIEGNSPHTKYIITKNPELFEGELEALTGYKNMLRLERALAEHKKVLDQRKITEDQKLKDLTASLAKQSAKCAPYFELLKKWQPYGLLLQIALFSSPSAVVDAIARPEMVIINPHSQKNTISDSYEAILEHLITNGFNVLDSPQLADIKPFINEDEYSSTGFWEQVQKRVRYLKKSVPAHAKKDLRHFDIKHLETIFADVLLDHAQKALVRHDIEGVYECLEELDDATYGVYNLRAIPRTATTALLDKVITYLQKTNADEPLARSTGWTTKVPFDEAANICREIANQSTDAQAKKSFARTANVYRCRLMCFRLMPLLLLTGVAAIIFGVAASGH